MQTSSWPVVVLAAFTMLAGTALVGTGTVTAGSATPPAGRGTQASESTATRTTAVTQHGRPRVTRVRRVSPLNPAGKLRRRYRVTSTARGYCWTTSSLDGRLYRCFKRNLIQDPCWKQRGRRSVICLRRPWSRQVTRLRLTRRLPDNAHYGGRFWGLTMAPRSGGHCLRRAGAGGNVGRRPISFFCRRGWVLVGQPNRSRRVWTIATARWVGDHYERRGRRPIRTAWRVAVR